MKLIITSRRGSTAGGLGRYSGGDIFRCIGRQGLKRAISTIANSTLAQNLANAVVNGGQKKAVTAVVPPKTIITEERQAQRFNENHTPLIGKKPLKRRSTTVPLPAVLNSSPPTKKEKIDINKVINGAGIVLD